MRFRHAAIVQRRQIGLAYCKPIGKSYTLSGHTANHYRLMEALKTYLIENDITQSAFADRLGVSQPTVANLVNGVHGASNELLRKIMLETGLTADKLLSGAANRRGKSSVVRDCR